MQQHFTSSCVSAVLPSPFCNTLAQVEWQNEEAPRDPVIPHDFFYPKVRDVHRRTNILQIVSPKDSVPWNSPGRYSNMQL